jgi:hypothetical protein
VPRNPMGTLSRRTARLGGGRGRSCSDLLDDAPCLTGVGQRLPRVAVRSPRAERCTSAWFRERGKRGACPKSQRTTTTPDNNGAAPVSEQRCQPHAAPAPRGSGAAAPSGARRAIDRSARPRLRVGLRPAPPSAAISSLIRLPYTVARQGLRRSGLVAALALWPMLRWPGSRVLSWPPVMMTASGIPAASVRVCCLRLARGAVDRARSG